MFDGRLEFLYGTESCQRVKESGRDRSGKQAGEREGRERETFRVRTSAREGKEKRRRIVLGMEKRSGGGCERKDR